MKFVNHTSKNIYTSLSGGVNAGRTTLDRQGDFAECAKRIVDSCGKNLYIVFSASERNLVNRLLELDRLGSSFKRGDIPENVMNDPLGEKRAIELAKKLQKASMDVAVERNRDKERRQRIIDGETEEPRDEGVSVKDEIAKGEFGGFRDILEANAKLAARKKEYERNGGIMNDPLVTGKIKGDDRKGAEIPDTDILNDIPKQEGIADADPPKPYGQETPKPGPEDMAGGGVDEGAYEGAQADAGGALGEDADTEADQPSDNH